MLLFSMPIDNAEDQAFMLDVYEQHKGLMYRIANDYLSDAQEAEDLVQDCIEKLIKKVDTLKGLNAYALTAYVAYTVKNTATNYLKRRSLRNRYSAEAETSDMDYMDASPSPEELLLLSERIDEFHIDFARLPENERQLLVSKYILDLSDAELAEMFGCKPESIRMKLTRARRKAIQLFMEGELFSGQT